MNRQISSQDWQDLSDYLDHQMSVNKKASFEARLHQEPELSEALQNLRIAQKMLRSLPRQKVPRSFALTPASLPRQVSAFPYTTTFSLVSAFCTLLFILSFLLQPSSFSSPVLQSNLKAAPQAEALLPAGRNINAPTPQVFVWGSPSQSQGSGQGGGSDGLTNPLHSTQQNPLPQAPPNPDPVAGLSKSAPTLPAPPAALSIPESATDKKSSNGGGLIIGLRPTLEQGLETSHYPTKNDQGPPASNSTASFPLPQEILAGLALCSALAAFIFWFRNRP